MRLWGLYLIPRDKAPDEGFLLARTPRSGPGSAGDETGRRHARWKAWWLPLRGFDEENGCPRPDGPHYRADRSFDDLVESLTKDHIQ